MVTSQPLKRYIFLYGWVKYVVHVYSQTREFVQFFLVGFQYVGINIAISTSYSNFALSNFLGYNISSSVLEKLCQTSSLGIQTWKKK